MNRQWTSADSSKTGLKAAAKKTGGQASSTTTTSTPLVFERLNSTYLTIGCYIKSLSQEQQHSNNKPHKVDFLVDCFLSLSLSSIMVAVLFLGHLVVRDKSGLED